MSIKVNDMIKECSIKDGELTLCTSLDSKLPELANAHNKGFTQVTTFHMKTGVYRNIGVAYKKSGSDRGSMINFCPWCGKNIENWEK
jgi:hypothetical protein